MKNSTYHFVEVIALTLVCLLAGFGMANIWETIYYEQS